MNRKRAMLLLLFLLIVVNFIILLPNQFQTDRHVDELVTCSSITQLLALDNNTSDFQTFTYTGNPDAWDNTNYLYVNHDSQDYETRESYSTYDMSDVIGLTSMSFDYKLRCENLYAVIDATEFNASFYITYTNNSRVYIYNRTWYNYGFENYIDEGTQNFELDSDAQIANFTLYLYTRTYNVYGVTYHNILRAYLWNVRFHGYMPAISNIEYSQNVKQGENAVLSCNLAYIDAGLNQNITFSFVTSGNTRELTMSNDWTDDTKYFIETSFSTIGFYKFIIEAWGVWNYTLSSVYTFYVGDYPKSSYLSLFSNLDGFPLESKDFKVYLGDDEEVSLVNFRDYYGNWSQIYAGIVNASLIDNYLQFNCSSNGLKTNFENDAVHDTLVYNTLLFDARVSNNTRLVVIYNPQFHEKDYYIDFTSDMANLWYSIEVPFFLFNQYNNISNDNLYELGFWLKNNSIQLANIRVATRYNKTYLQQAEIALNMTESAISNVLDVQDHANGTVLEFESAQNGVPFAFNITDGFNNTGASWENVTILDNATIMTNNSNHFDGNETFYNDEVDSQPSGWTIANVPLRGTILVKGEVDNHKKYVELYDTSTGGGVAMYKSIDECDSSGIVEFWFGQDTFTAYSANLLYLREGTTQVLFAGSYYSDVYNSFAMGAQGTPLINYVYYENDSRILLDSDTFYRIKMVFDFGTNEFSGYIANGLGNYELCYNSTGHSVFKLATTATEINNMYFATGYSTTNCKIYVDSIDLSWTEGYYSNRIGDYIECDAFYVSDVVNFNRTVNVDAVNVSFSELGNTTIDIYVSDNQTSEFDAWVNYSVYNQTNMQFLKFKVLLNCTNTTNLPVFHNITFNYTIYTYNMSLTLNFSYYNADSYQNVFNSTNIMRIKTNTSIDASNISIYDYNQSKHVLNQTFDENYANYTFFYTNNSIYENTSLNNTFLIYCNSSVPFKVLINLVYLTTVYNKTRYFSNHNVSLLDEFENLYFYVLNNNSLTATFNLINETHSFYSDAILNQSNWQDRSHFVNSSTIYLQFNYTSFENESIYMREIFETKNETYRLISIDNRQNPNELIFTSPTASIAILDYFDNVLYRDALEYSAFVDIALPICTMTVYNYYDRFIYVTIQRGLGVEIEIAIAPESSISLRVFSTSYLLHVRNHELQTLLLQDFSPDSSDQVVFQFGERQAITFDPYEDFTVRMLEFIAIALAVVAIVVTVVTNESVKRFFEKLFRKEKKTRQKRKLREEWTPTTF